MNDSPTTDIVDNVAVEAEAVNEANQCSSLEVMGHKVLVMSGGQEERCSDTVDEYEVLVGGRTRGPESTRGAGRGHCVLATGRSEATSK